jgi:hypothetical protein
VSGVDEFVAYVEGLGGVLTLRPGPGDGSPEIAWGDAFFYYAPDGVVPKSQPFATVVTKDYPGEPSSGLDEPGAFRVNLAAGAADFQKWAAQSPTITTDTILPHPVYSSLNWLCVVNPGPRATADLQGLLRSAHDLARARYDRRADAGSA